MVAVYANGTLIADSSATKVVEGNHYFLPSALYSPPNDIKKEYFQPSETHTVCPWKGTASYYTVKIGSEVIPDAAWYYPDCKEGKAKEIEGYVAFYKNKVKIHE
ncbi:hypothetical protein JCM3774_006469 [Rhodotorula dairenensis]